MSEIATRMRSLLQRIHTQQELTQRSLAVKPRLSALRAWQARRLASSYQDIHQREPFIAACTFFLEDLYGEGDFADRDRAVERVVPIMMRMLPEAVLESLARAIELNALSQELDFAMANALPERCVSADLISDEDYARAYSATAALESWPLPVLSWRSRQRASAAAATATATANTPAVRERRCTRANARRCRREQLALLLILGRELDRLVRKPLLNELLRMCRWPARLAGLGALQSFLERGFAAFGKLGGAGEFLRTISRREIRFMGAVESVLAADPAVKLQSPNSWSR